MQFWSWRDNSQIDHEGLTSYAIMSLTFNKHYIIYIKLILNKSIVGVYIKIHFVSNYNNI